MQMHAPQFRGLVVVRVKERDPQDTYNGNCKYQQPHFKTCVHVKTATVFSSTIIGREFRLKATVDRRTSNVVYSIECMCLSYQEVIC